GGGSRAPPRPAPTPPMTTSVFLRSMAMAASLHSEGCIRVGGLAHGFCPHVHALLVGGDYQAQAGVTDQIPADEIGIAAVVGIAERALDGVGAHEVEERRGVRRKTGGDVLLHVGEHRVLVWLGKFG